MAGRSKEAGKLVAELSAAELLREQDRCRKTIKSYGQGPAVKLLKKRLHEIKQRIAPEAAEHV